MKRLSLRSRIILILAALVLTTLCGGLISKWHTYRMGHLFTSVIDTAVMGLQAAEELETALVRQKGLTTYYFLDGNPDWLKQLGEYRQIFKERLNEARQGAGTAAQKAMIERIAAEYDLYVESKDRVLDLYQQGNREEGARLRRGLLGIRDLLVIRDWLSGGGGEGRGGGRGAQGAGRRAQGVGRRAQGVGRRA